MGKSFDKFSGKSIQKVISNNSLNIRKTNYLVSIFQRKPRDAIYAPYQTDHTGGALNSALDVMNYAADIVVPVNGPMTPASLTPKTIIPNQDAHSVTTTHSVNFKDPLRELVLIAETIGDDETKTDTAVLSSVNSLAIQAAVLENVHEIRPVSVVQPAQIVPSHAAIGKGQTGTTTLNMFQDPKDNVDPVKEREFLKRLELLEDGDSEGIDGNYKLIIFVTIQILKKFSGKYIEKPVLGKISLIRRAKSAVSRTASAKKTNDKHPLFHVAWNDLEKQAGLVNNAFEATPAKRAAEETAPLEEEGAPTTVEEVRRHMAQFHMRKSQQPGLSRQVMDPQTGKFRRAKTARNK